MKDAAPATCFEVQYKKRSQGPEIWRRFKKNKRALLGLIIIVIIILSSVFAPFVATHDPALQNPKNRLVSASLEHIMGTDDFGRDIFSRVVYGGRISLTIGLLSTIFACVIGALFGAVAGYYGGRLESVIMRIMDIFLSIPNLLLAVAIAATLGAGIFNTIIAVTITGIPAYCRVMHSAVLIIRDQEFIEATRAAGASDLVIILENIVPNCLAPLIVQVTMRIGAAIMISSSLSFVGVGVSPPTPEWGSMLSKGREFLRQYPHLTIYPGLAMLLSVFSLNLMGDGLRDALDPKLKT